jgi:hypothetical protein
MHGPSQHREVRNNHDMHSAFQIVVFGAVALSVLMSIVFLVGKGGSVYDEIGQGSFTGEGKNTHGRGTSEPPAGVSELEASSGNILLARPERERIEREQEIRQMLQARSERLERRGEPGLDVDAEVARLTAVQSIAPQRDQGIEEEVLQLVVARNERRERQGLEPLDIQAEVARTLAEFDV